MSLLTNFYYDWVDVATGRRKRLWYRAPFGGTRATTGTPAFGADPGVGSTWTKLPVGFVKPRSDGNFAFDGGVALGVPDPPTWGFQFDLKPIRESANTDIQAIEGYLIDPVYGMGGNITWYTTVGRGVDAYGVFVLLNDGGSPTAAVADFNCEWYGLQTERADVPLDINMKTGETLIDVDTIHIGIAIWRSLKTTDLFKHMIGTTAYPVTYRSMIYDQVVKPATAANLYLRVLGTSPSESVRQTFGLYRLRDLWTGLAYLAGQMLYAQTGDPTPQWHWAMPTGYPSTLVASGTFALAAQSYATGGAADTTGIATEADALIIGTVQLTGSTDVVGGMFSVDQTDVGFIRYTSLGDLFKDLIEGSTCKITLQTSHGSLGITGYCSPAAEAALLNGIQPINLRPNGRIKPVLRKSATAGAEADVVGSTGADVPHHSIQTWPGDEVKLRTVPIVFDTAPSVGDADDVQIAFQASGAWNGEINVGGSLLFMLTADVRVNTLVYLDQPAWATQPIPFRYHHHVGVRTISSGDITYPTLMRDAPTVPWLTLPPGSMTEADILQYLAAEIWPAWRLNMIEIQRYGTLGYAAVARLADLMSRRRAYNLPMVVAAGSTGMNDLGSWSDLDMAVTLSPIFAAIGAGESTIVSMSMSHGKDVVDVEYQVYGNEP